ncbi:MAG: hypothetical protein M3Z21_02685, partial [Pseudomonadota bacterium]|nr:hypothetical protein [Pseudomonadota bacterium]
MAGFRQRKALLVWDNFESTLPAFQEGEDDVLPFSDAERGRLLQLYRELTEGSPQGRLLITCRPQETGLPGIKEMALEGLARPDSLHLLAAVREIKSLSIDRPGYERHEIDTLLDDLADHPLSLELIAPHLKDLPPGKIRSEFETLLARFAEGGAFESRNRSLLASLEFSKRRLSESARAVLPWLAWFRGGVFEEVLLRCAELEPERWAAVR